MTWLKKAIDETADLQPSPSGTPAKPYVADVPLEVESDMYKETNPLPTPMAAPKPWAEQEPKAQEFSGDPAQIVWHEPKKIEAPDEFEGLDGAFE